MVGSTNGRGVCVSMKSGRLIATLEPRRRRMFAVSVLERQTRVERGTGHREEEHRRETCMGVRDLLREEETVARYRTSGVIVWLRKDARSAQPRVRRHRERHLVGLEVLPGEGAPVRGIGEGGCGEEGSARDARTQRWAREILTGSACRSPRRADRGSRPSTAIRAWTRA